MVSMKRALVLITLALVASLGISAAALDAGASSATVTAPATQVIRDAGCHTYRVHINAPASYRTTYDVVLSRNGNVDWPDGVWVEISTARTSFDVPNLMLCGARAALYTVTVSASVYSSAIVGYRGPDGNACSQGDIGCVYIGEHVQVGSFGMVTHTRLRRA